MTLSSAAPSVGCASAQAVATAPPNDGGGGSPPPPSGTIATAAGGGIGDGGPALDAVFFLPSYAIFDRAGNLYMSTQQRVIEVTPAGIATTIAGTGTFSFQPGHVYYGDGGPATAATFGQSGPSGLAFDAAGNLYVADTGNGVVRKVDTSGVITTVAGGGPTGRYGLEGDDPRSVYLWAPDGLAVDAVGNLFIADSGNCTIREVKATDGRIYTVAGIPPGESGPTTRVTCGYTADGVPALGSALNQPKDVKVDAAGNLYVSDLGNSRVRKIDAAGIVHTVAGDGSTVDSGDGGPATSAGVPFPWHIALDPAGGLLVVEYFSHVVRRVDAAGTIERVAGSGTKGFAGDGGPAVQAQLLFPLGVAVAAGGDVYVADFGNNRVRRVDASTGTIATIAGNGDPPHVDNVYFGNGFAGDGLPARSAALNGPLGVAVDDSGDLYVADTSNRRVRRVDGSTGVIETIAAVPGPSALALDRHGDVYVAGGVVRKIDSHGNVTTVVSVPGLAAVGLAIDRAGNLYVADGAGQRVVRVDRKGRIMTVAGNGTRGFGGDGGPATAAQLDNPRGLALDSAGNLYVADAGNDRIRKVDTLGVITTVAGSGESGYDGDGGPATATALNFPVDVAVDAAGSVFLSDTGNCLVRRVDAATGRIEAVAGVPLAFSTANPGFMNCDFNGDGGPATAAHVFAPTGLELDANGNLFFDDTTNNRVRVIYGIGVTGR